MEAHSPADKSGIGNRLRQVRKDAGLTQVQFAEKVGYTQGHVNLTESGKVGPSDVYLKKVINIFGISENWIRSGEGDMTSEVRVDSELIEWLNEHPEEIVALRRKMG